MKSIRIGNDISVQWLITHNGLPESLEGRKLAVILSCPLCKREITDFKVVGNAIRFTFYGKDQRYCGVYTLTLVENRGERGMMAVDECDVFKIVPRSCMTGDGDDDSDLEISSVYLGTEIHHLNNPDNTVVSDTVNRIEVMTQEEYDSIEPEEKTLYIIL